MATALQQPAPDAGPVFNEVSTALGSPHVNDYPSRLSIVDLDLKDNRYPTLGSSPRSIPSVRKSVFSYPERSMDGGVTDGSRGSWVSYPASGSPKSLANEKLDEVPVEKEQPLPVTSLATKQQTQSSNAEGTLPANAMPSGDSPRLAGRPSREDPPQRRSSKSGSAELRRVAAEIVQSQQNMGQRTSSVRPLQGQLGPMLPPAPRHPSIPVAGIGAGPSGSPALATIPMSATPSFSPSAMQVHISPKPRASAQYPTYITPPSGQDPLHAAYAPPQIPKEEVCVECAMRDQDMADVDVTSPGAWERESDAAYEELVHREREEEASGVPRLQSSSRPRARGQPLSEENLRIWLSINPKEPSSRQQTLDAYVRSQRLLLEQEALAHARALRESRQLEDKMRDTYTQLRRSAYELNGNAQLTDDTAGVRIKPPRATSIPASIMVSPENGSSHNREVTLLENGMIVEHVDVRKEEREERARKRKEEKRDRSRARKSSRGSIIDVTSVYSMPLPGQGLQSDSGYFSGAKGSDSRYSQSFSPRPSSILTTGDRPHMLPRAYSQASFSDMQSIGSSSSPRRSRFFGFKNLTASWRSQDSLAPSGSMMDMHVALQREQQYMQEHGLAEMSADTPTLRVAETWVQDEAPSPIETSVATSGHKKKNGLKKIWKIVTGSSHKNGCPQKGRVPARSLEKPEDDAPLAPPPPLSYLVDRDRGSRRHVSTPSLPTSISPNFMSPYTASPPTAPSSLLPSPTSSRHPINEKDSGSDGRKTSGNLDSDPEHQAGSGEPHSPDQERGRTTQSSSKTLSSMTGPLTPQSTRPHSVALRRDKSLPPLPPESSVEFPNHPNGMPDARPQTMFTYDHVPMSFSGAGPEMLLPPNAPFRTADQRRQSFGGTGSKPHPAVRTLPVKGKFLGAAVSPPFLAEERYGEFGASRHSLAQWASSRGTHGTAKPRPRRSKFGLSSLFRRKSHDLVDENKENGHSDTEFASNGIRTSGSEREDTIATGNAYSGAGSANSSHAQKMSITSRKNIAELVEQDPEFVAYRYPSTDHRFDLR
ncbi:uncharacterized protein LAESUDRAFT_734470 [Laetiporus sulphureus 93-53]|uniref:Proteophosphoglycan ppg4 n=1 Tax=Laetiporus sulphureus 93-53 TaxID=1314785 RepID=A0A165GPW6_9APHY|nr:uncharacterized protein LAESUDRAFT_734470 [Laetiporus sulphureus 93-53]KZT10645.1 hypothetical protein LAESUDRAFT_734470 [Laetiporus sulphureus 93-53]